MPVSPSRSTLMLAVLMLTCAMGGGLVVALVMAPAQAEVGSTVKTTADYGDDTSNFVIPYDGFLTLDSTPLSGGIDLEFRLYEEDNGTLATTPEWTEQQTVNGYNGRFSVGLGSVERINEDLLDAERLYLEIAIVNADGSTTTLGGVQAIEPVPYAIWSAHAANLNVAGDATVGGTLGTGGSATVGGNASVVGTLGTGGNATLGDAGTDSHTANGSLDVTGSLDVAGNLEVDGTTLLTQAVTTLAGLQVGGWLNVAGTDMYLGTSTSRGDGGRALVQNTSDTLYLNFAGDFSGGTVLDSNTTVDGNLTIVGDVQVNGDDLNSDNSLLRLNVTRNLPVQIPTLDSQVNTDGDTNPEVYVSPFSDANTSVLGTTTCNGSNHGALAVGRMDGKTDREGLCVCMRAGLTTGAWYEWVCFTK